MANLKEIPDEGSLSEADPALRAAMTKAAGAAVLQGLETGTYWAENAGDVKKPGVHHLMMRELRSNMRALMAERMTYIQMEDYLQINGYGVEDIRLAFEQEPGTAFLCGPWV